MKKVKVTFWLLGFGCGIALAGMIGTLFTLRIDSVIQQQTNVKENTIIDEAKIERQNNTKEQSNEESSVDPVLSKNSQENLNDNQTTIDSYMPAIDTQQKEVNNYCEVYIPDTSSASEICEILEEAGIVESGKDFHEYIKEHRKQTRLKDGMLNLPIQSDYETLLALLLA